MLLYLRSFQVLSIEYPVITVSLRACGPGRTSATSLFVSKNIFTGSAYLSCAAPTNYRLVYSGEIPCLPGGIKQTNKLPRKCVSVHLSGVYRPHAFFAWKIVAASFSRKTHQEASKNTKPSP